MCRVIPPFNEKVRRCALEDQEPIGDGWTSSRPRATSHHLEHLEMTQDRYEMVSEESCRHAEMIKTEKRVEMHQKACSDKPADQLKVHPQFRARSFAISPIRIFGRYAVCLA